MFIPSTEALVARAKRLKRLSLLFKNGEPRTAPSKTRLNGVEHTMDLLRRHRDQKMLDRLFADAPEFGEI